ncbi:MAG: hypothetical protein ABII90_10215 [Bacteroidota bacterium]
MPYTKIKSGTNKGKFKSPSGRVMSKEQVQAYYASKSSKKSGKGKK